ncbi:MAG: methionine--tRNA ligase subunit beta, partial [candidate division Zixibacteria bacterium]|nr:methionine--tRNA ligase subunit beta [candidate division Zixibacteria bacterium]
EGKTEELGGVLYACCEILRIVSIMLYPIMPNKMQELRSVLSLDDSTLSLKNAQTFFELKPGIKIELKEAIFPRLDVKKAAALKTDSKSSDNSDNNRLLDYAEFARAKLKVAVVIEAEKIEGTDKLLKLQIDLGTEKRQIVAGVAEFYSPEEIKGKKIIVVSNLKPAKIRGVESNGMLLAAKSDGKLTLVSLASDLPAGSDVS